MLAAMRARTEAERGTLPDSARARMEERPPADGGSARGSGGATLLWYLDASGQPSAARVRTGITDGQYTAIEGRELTEGLQVIAGILQDAPASSSSPFESGQAAARPRPGGI
jgi:hypothetical protein